MLFVDNIYFCDENRAVVEGRLEEWKEALERSGMKVSRAKVELLRTNDEEIEGMGQDIR